MLARTVSGRRLAREGTRIYDMVLSTGSVNVGCEHEVYCLEVA
jgi:hypothetical protein